MKNRSIRAQQRASVFSFLSLTLLASANAQTIEVDPMVISASRMPQYLSEVLPSVSVITRQDIDKSQALTLADVLQGETGFEFGRNGGPGSTTSFFLRGQDSTNLVVLIDGVRAQTDKIGAIQITDFPLQQIERIEILKGNASALYGAGAIGGVINIITRQTKGTPKAYGSASAGSYNTLGAFAGYGGTVDDVSFDLNAGHSRSNGFSAMDTSQKKYANPDADGYRNEYAALRAEKRISAETQIGARFNYNLQDADYDSSYSWQDTPSDIHKFKKTNKLASAYLRQQFNADWISNLSVSRSEYSYRDTRNGMPWPASGYTNSFFEGSQSALAWSNTYQLRARTVASFGADFSEDNFKGMGSQVAYSLNRRSQAYFTGLTHELDRLSLSLNVRHDRLDMQKQNSAVTGDYSGSTGLAGLGYQLTPSWKLTATVSSGFKAPTADAVSSNASIRPEHHRSQEIGAVYKSGDALLRMVYFQSQSKDAIIYTNTYSYVNGDIDNKGVEFTVRARVGAYAIRSSLTFQDPRDVLQNLPQARRAKQYGSIDVSRMWFGYELGSRLYASAYRPDSNFNPGVALPGYAMWSFYASRKLDEQWTARLRLDNAFDKHYQLAYGYNTPGRGLYATLQYSPK